MKNMQGSQPPYAESGTARQDLHAYLLGLLSVAAFALTLPLTKVLTGHLSALQIGLFRSLIAACAAVPILVATRSRLPNWSQLRRLFATSLGIVYGFPILTALGMTYVPVSHGGVVLAALPLSTAIFGTLITRSRPSLSFWVVSLLGFAAVVAYTLSRHELRGVYIGDIALFGAVLLAGFGYAQGGALSKEMKGWQVMCWTLAISLPLLLPLSALVYTKSAFAALDTHGWFTMAFLALVNSLLGFFSWNRALALGGIQRISQLQLLQPFFTYGYSVLFMHEMFDWPTLSMCAVVILLVLISKRTQAPSRVVVAGKTAAQ
jgi:drug/metabolite transporter (DMT)-like permease